MAEQGKNSRILSDIRLLKTSLSLVMRKRIIEDKPRYPKVNELFEKLFYYKVTAKSRKENINAFYFDEETLEKYIFTDDLLINQLQRLCPSVCNSFDIKFFEEFKHLSSDIDKILPIQFVGHKMANRENDELLIVCGDLLRNSTNTVIAATQTLRCGFRLQSGILLRTSIEICATVVHLLTQPDKLNNFRANKLESTKSISVANKQIPLYGKVWGLLSQKFIHIGSFHTDYYPLDEYSEKEEIPAKVTLGMLGFATLILAITTELTFINVTKESKYWVPIGNHKYKFIPPDNSQMVWAEKLLRNT